MSNDENEVTSPQLELSYGKKTMILLEGFFGCGGKSYAERNNLPVPAEFWEWRKENKKRGGVLNKAGLVLEKREERNADSLVTRSVWRADLSAVTADTLDEAVDDVRAWTRTEKELKDRANLYMRQCEATKYRPGGQFGGPK